MKVMPRTGTVLDQILQQTAEDLSQRMRAVPIGDLYRVAADRREITSLARSIVDGPLSVIAEVKRGSPSKGNFPVIFDADDVARSYLDGGAAAISCLTDEPFFRGSLTDLRVVVSVAHSMKVPAPVLRKDFIVDPYQIVEAKAYGADAVLLITAALTQDYLKELRAFAESLGLEALVEIHDEPELERAVESGARLVGINNRDLRTLEVDLAVTERLAPMLPAGTIAVGESGILNRDDAVRMAKAGVHAILVGEALIVHPDRSLAVRLLRGLN